MAIEVDDDEISAGLEALRSKHGPIKRHGGGHRPGSGKVSALRKAASTAALISAAPPAMPSASELKKAAVDSVQAGLIASLDRDCRNYRAQIKNLTRQIEAMGVQFEAEKSGAMQDAYTAKLTELEEQLAASHREREALLATVSRLSREKGSPQEALAQAEAQLASARAEIVDLKAQLAEGGRQLEETRKLRAEADAATQSYANRYAALESELAAARAANAKQLEAEKLLRAELSAAHASTDAAKLECAAAVEENHRVHAQLERANLDSVEAKAESSTLARKLAAMAERRDERDRTTRASEDADKKKAMEKALKEAAEARKEAQAAKSDLSSSKAEATRANELVRTLRSKLVEATETLRPELDSRDEELAKAKKGGERQRERADKAEKLNGEAQAELLRLRTALEESKSECEGLRAMAESARLSAPAVRDTPKESLVPMSEQGGGQTAFGKYQRKITELEAECSSLRAQLAGMANSSPALNAGIRGPAIRSGRGSV